MKTNIHLISTVHREKGNCTSESLFEILHRIKPDVVFCEVSPKMYESFKKGSVRFSLELNSIKKLSKYHSFSFVAIDTHPTPEGDFRKQVSELFDSIEKDKEHTNAWRKNNTNTHLYGFEYLNSDESIRICDELARREKTVVDRLPEHRGTYTEWANIHNNRENEMLENIDFYVKNNELEKAVFLCGSGHRKSLINKIKKKNNIRLGWSFELPK